MRVGRRRLLAGMGVAAVWPALAACGDAGTDGPAAGGSERLELLLDEPATIDPALASLPNEFTIVQALFEPLVTIAPDGAPTPGVAESWQITDAGRAYTFKLRENARWTNGDAVTADDFAWAWRRNLSPKLGGAFNYLMFPIRGAEGFAFGIDNDEESVQVTTPDPQTLHVRLVQPTPGFLARLATPTFYPLPRAEIEETGLAWTRPASIRGNGAYRLAQWDPSGGTTLFRNEHHWGGPARFASIVARFPPDDASRIGAFRGGLAHAAEVRGRDFTAASSEPAIRERLRLFERSGSWFVVLNTAKPPFDRAAVRRALSLVLDRPGLVTAVFDEPTLPAGTITPPSVLGREPATMEPDIEAARTLLAGAGFPGGQGFPAVRFTYHRTPTWQRLAGELSTRWRDALGITLLPDERDWRDFLSFTDDPGDFDMYRGGWTSEYADPVNWYDDLWRSERDYLRAHWIDSEFDAQLEIGAHSRDPAERMNAYAAADAALEAGVPAIPIGYRAAAYLLKPEVSAFRVDPVGGAIDVGAVSLDG